MRLAEVMGLPLWKVKRITPFSEFLLWRAKWDKEEEDEFKKTTKLEYYLAQIAREVRVVLYKSADAKKVSLKDFLLKFKFQSKQPATPPPRPAEAPPAEDQIEKKTVLSKSFWFALVGLSSKKDMVNGKENSTRRASGGRNR